VLLALIPYVASVIMYAVASTELFREHSGLDAPSNWNWRFVAPVTLGGLTPLSLAARHGIDSGDRFMLLTEPAVAILYTIIAMSTLRDVDKFNALLKPVGTARVKYAKLPLWRIVWMAGALIILYGAVINVVVAGS